MTYRDSTSNAGPSAVRDREGPGMLLMNEALARSRSREAEQAARDHAIARQLVAGRRWARFTHPQASFVGLSIPRWLADFAARRAERARAGAAG